MSDKTLILIVSYAKKYPLKVGCTSNTLIITKCSPNYIVHKSPNLAFALSLHISPSNFIIMLSSFWGWCDSHIWVMCFYINSNRNLEKGVLSYESGVGPIKSGLETCLRLSTNSKGLPHYLHRAILHASQWHFLWHHWHLTQLASSQPFFLLSCF